MTALLDIPEIRARALPLSVENYHRLGEGLHAELLRGVLVEKMPKSPLHRKLVRRLVKALEGHIQPGLEVWKEDPLTFTDSEPEPDLAVVMRRDDEYATAHPATAELVIEVAVSSLEIDRVKALIYAEAGIQEYWIIRPEEKQVEVYRRPGPAGFTEMSLAAAPAFLDSTALHGIRVDLDALFA